MPRVVGSRRVAKIDGIGYDSMVKSCTVYWFAAAVLSVAACAAADEPAGTSWKFDVVRLKNGSTFRGLITEQTPAFIRFHDVRQKPGRPIVVFYTSFAASEIDSIERLNDADREQLQTRLRELTPENSEKQRMHRVELKECPWGGNPTGGLQYRSDCFTLISNSRESIVRRSAVRLEQIYAAYARFLPSRVELTRPTTIELFRSADEYAARLRADGHQFVNTAFYDPVNNRILCTGDLSRLGDDLENARIQSQRLRTDLDQRETSLTRLYKGAELAKLLQPIRATRTSIDAADRANDGLFDKATQQLFSVLYHEAFHAYLANFVCPPPQPELPRWLNEGLAQIFESAQIDAGELRVGHADRDRLARAKEIVRRGEPLSVSALLKSGAGGFLATHPSLDQSVDRNYLAAWAVAYHLTFERRLLGHESLTTYLRALASGSEPNAAFAAFVGHSVADYERDLNSYLLRLQSDGSLAAAP